MVDKISTIKILQQTLRVLPPRAAGRLKGVATIRSFEIGRIELDPALRTLFAREDFTPGEIHLDLPAKLRLLAMSPTLVQRVRKGESAKVIFSSLELSLFTGANNDLFILGDKGNIRLLGKTQKRKQNVRSAPVRQKTSKGIFSLPVTIPGSLTSFPSFIPSKSVLEAARASEMARERANDGLKNAASIGFTRQENGKLVILMPDEQEKLRRLGLEFRTSHRIKLDYYDISFSADSAKIKKIKYLNPDRSTGKGKPALLKKGTAWFLIWFSVGSLTTDKGQLKSTLGYLDVTYRDETMKRIKLIYRPTDTAI